MPHERCPSTRYQTQQKVDVTVLITPLKIASVLLSLPFCLSGSRVRPQASNDAAVGPANCSPGSSMLPAPGCAASALQRSRGGSPPAAARGGRARTRPLRRRARRKRRCADALVGDFGTTLAASGVPTRTNNASGADRERLESEETPDASPYYRAEGRRLGAACLKELFQARMLWI